MRKAVILLLLSAFPLVAAHADWKDGADYADTILITALPYTLPQNNAVYVLSGNLSSNNGGLVINGRSYVKIEGAGDTIRFDADGSGYVNGMEINNGSHHVSVANLTVLQAVASGSYGSPGGDYCNAILLGQCEWVFLGNVNAHVRGHSSNCIDGGGGTKQAIEIWMGNYSSFSHSYDSRMQFDGAAIRLGGEKASPDTFHFYIHEIRIDSCPHAGVISAGRVWIDSNFVQVDAFNDKPGVTWANAHALGAYGSYWAGSHIRYNTLRTGSNHYGGRGMNSEFAAGTADKPVEIAYNDIRITQGYTGEADAARGIRVRWGCFYLRVHHNYIEVSCDDNPATQHIGTEAHGIWFGAIGEEGSELGAHNWFYNNQIHANYYGAPENAPSQATCFIADVIRDPSQPYGNDNRSFNNHFYSNVRCLQLGEDWHECNEFTSVNDTIEWQAPQYTCAFGRHLAVGVGSGPYSFLRNRLIDPVFINCSSADVGNRDNGGTKSIYAMRSINIEVTGTNGLPIVGATARIWDRYGNTSNNSTAVVTATTNSRGIVADTLPYWFKRWDGTALTDSTYNNYVIRIEKDGKTAQSTITLADVTTQPRSVQVDIALDTLGQAVTNVAPTAPTLSSPANGSTAASLQPTLVVSNGADADGDPLTYQFELYDAGGTNLIASESGIPQGVGVTSWTVSTTLATGTQYRWRARCTDGLDYSPWMSNASFTTPTPVDNTPPDSPTMHSPTQGAITNQTSPTLTVLNANDVDGDNLTYFFEVYDAAGATLVASAGAVSEGPYYTTWTVSPALGDNTTYSWRSRCYDGEDYSNWTSLWQFSIDQSNPLDMPSHSSPLAGGSVVGEPIVLIVNNAGHQAGIDVTYDFYVYSDAGLNDQVDAILAVPETFNRTAATCTFTPTHSAQYWWRVRATDGTNTTAFTTATSFTFYSIGTGETTIATTAYPPSGGTVESRQPQLTAQNVTETGYHDYYFEVATDPTFANLVDVSGAVPQGTSDETTWQVGEELTEGVTYYWHVRADNYAFSPTATFDVVPTVFAYPNPVRFSQDGHVTFQLSDEATDLMIQTVSGETVLVQKDVSGDWQWDGRNSAGNPVAIGTYLWYVSVSGQSGKLVVKP